MKKTIFILAIVAMFAACGSHSNSTAVDTTKVDTTKVDSVKTDSSATDSIRPSLPPQK